MLQDTVIDTNVFLHSQTPSDQYFQDALDFITLFLEKNTLLCVDEGFDVIESENRSLIGGEYLKTIMPGSSAFAALVTLATSGRIRLLGITSGQKVKKTINQTIRNKRDRTFLHVAFNSSDKILVSHDHKDFQITKRAYLKNEIGVHVILASECVLLL